MMTEEQIRLVEESFEQIATEIDHSADLLYARLFELDPQLRPMFTKDRTIQGRKLVATFASVVRCLREPDRFSAELQALGQQHIAYGVQPQHYDTVATALFWMLEQMLGPFFQPSVRNAWHLAYCLIVTLMHPESVGDRVIST